jgi:putative transposase
MRFSLVRDLAADGVSVAVACETLGFSRQAYYAWLRRPCSARERDDAVLVDAIRDVHADDPEFGYRLIADELERAGHVASENRVHRLCCEHRVWSTTTRKGRRGTGKLPGPAVYDDLLDRDFTASRPDETWLADITEHPTAEGKLYLCAFKDACSRRIVGYAIGERMTAELAVTGLRTAIARRRPQGTLIVHSDRGSQFRSRRFRAVLAANRLRGSMGRVAAAGDNAAMESFYALLQKNVLDRRSWQSRDELRLAITVWIEHTYGWKSSWTSSGSFARVRVGAGDRELKRRGWGCLLPRCLAA